MRIDLVGVDFMRIDLVAPNQTCIYNHAFLYGWAGYIFITYVSCDNVLILSLHNS